MVVAFFPGVMVMYMFRNQIREGEISIKTVSDLFAFGATISVMTSLLFEGLIFGWVFGTKDDNVSNLLYNKFGCRTGFPLYVLAILLKYIISIGLVEEGCKLMGLFTIKPHIEDLRYRESFTSHYVSSNLGFVIGGVSSSLGFALIENIAYLSNSMESIIRMLLIGVARAFLSVPFHISASGYTSILISRQIYKQGEDPLNDQRPPTNHHNSAAERCFQKLAALIPAGVLHGIYDSSLVILMLLEQDQDSGLDRNLANGKREPSFGQGIIFTKMSKLITLLSPPSHTKILNKLISSVKRQVSVKNSFFQCFDSDPLLLDFIGFGFFTLSVLSLSICILLFINNWMHLERQTFDRRLVPVTTETRRERGGIELVNEYIHI